MTVADFLKRTKVWVRMNWLWLWEAKLLWIAIAVIVFCLAVPSYVGFSEPAFRLSGLVLQMLGMFTVLKGLHETGQLFDRPMFWKAFKDWISRRPNFKPQVVEASGFFEFGMNFKARASVRSNPKDDSIEERTKSLERNIEILHEELDLLYRQVEAHEEISKQALKAETAVRSSALETINAQLKDSQVGGLQFAIVGAVWLFIGVVMSTASAELASIPNLWKATEDLARSLIASVSVGCR